MGKQRNETDLITVQNGSAIYGITVINKVNIGSAQELSYAVKFDFKTERKNETMRSEII